MVLKKILILIFVFSAFNFVNAQRASQVAWVSKFAVAGGVTPIWIIPDFGEINKQLKGFGVPEFPDGGMFTLGGSGYAYIKVIDNVRVGGIGFGGSVSEESIVNGFNREAIYNIGAGALTIEYSLPQVRKIAVSVGAMIGAGSIELELYQNKGAFTWDGVWQNFDNTNENKSRIIKNSFFTITPTINIDVPFNRFMAFRIGGGYLFSFGDDWKVDNDQEISNVPSSLNANSFFIQTGLFFGLFLF